MKQEIKVSFYIDKKVYEHLKKVKKETGQSITFQINKGLKDAAKRLSN